MAGKRITVNKGWAVYLNGEQVPGGETVAVDQDTAEHWIARGWATEAKAPAARAAGTTKTPKAAAKPAGDRPPDEKSKRSKPRKATAKASVGTRVPSGQAAKPRTRKP